MDKQKVIKYFGSMQKTADALGISLQAVHKWPDPIPQGRAYQLQILTRGKLKVRPEAYS